MNMKKCTFCGENIKDEAIKCRFCGEWLNKQPISSTSSNQLPPKGRLSLKNALIIVVIIALLLLANGIFTSNKPTSTGDQVASSDQANEEALRRVVLEQYQLVKSDDVNDLKKLYREFYAPDHRVYKESEDKFVNSILESHKLFRNENVHDEYEIQSIKVIDKRGYVDRTKKICMDVSCNEIKVKTRSVILYLFYKDKWLMSDKSVLCSREDPYSVSPEFERAYSLILQRTEGNELTLGDIRNCVLIRYASSDAEMKEAEGIFSFIPGQSTEKLEILVSPRYKLKDDLITSILLMHELTHADDYTSDLRNGESTDCYLGEARAFQQQRWFVSILNQEEKDSLQKRLDTGGSEELQSIKYVLDGIGFAKGSTEEERALNFVKSIPAYQKQCSE